MVRASDRHAADAGSIPWCGKGFFSQSQVSVHTLLRVSVHPRVQSHALASVCILKILSSMSEFDGLWKHLNTQHSQWVGWSDSVAADFSRGKLPQFPMAEIQMGQYSRKIYCKVKRNYSYSPVSAVGNLLAKKSTGATIRHNCKD